MNKQQETIMNKQRRNIIGAMAMVVVASDLAISSAGRLAAQDRPNIDAIVRQFHVNYSNGEVEKNGALVVASGFTSTSAGAAAENRPDIAALVRQFHSNYSKGEVEKNGEFVDDNVIVDVNGGAANQVNGITYRGRKEFVAFLKKDKVMFADGKIIHHELFVSGNMGAVRFTMEGTHTGPVPTPNGVLPATGRKIRLEVTEFFHFNSSGKLVHVHTLYNTQGLIMQLTAK